MTTSPPVTWDGLQLNPLVPDVNGVLPVVEDVTGWYDTPEYNGNDVELVLADGAVLGPKTAAPRVVTLTGSVTGPAAALAAFRDQLAVRTAALSPASLTIPDQAGRVMTASVRCDSGGFKHTFAGPLLFSYQVALTAADPRLYGPQAQLTLTNQAAGATGWSYPTGTLSSTLWRFAMPCTPNNGVNTLAFHWTVAALAFLPGSGLVAQQWGNTPAAGPANVTTFPVAFSGGGLAAGDTGVLVVNATASTTLTVTDSAGNTWREVAVSAASASGAYNAEQHVWIVENAKALGAGSTITVTSTVSASFVAGVARLSGVGAYIGSGTNSGVGSTVNMAMSVPAPQAVIVYCAANGTGNWTGAPPNWPGITGASSSTSYVNITVARAPGNGVVTLIPQAWSSVVACPAWGAAYPWTATMLAFDHVSDARTVYGWGWAALNNVTSGQITPNWQQTTLTAGDTGVVFIYASGQSAMTVTDTQGNTWTEIPALTPVPLTSNNIVGGVGTSQLDVHVFTCPNVKQLGPADHLTVNIATAQAAVVASCAGLSGFGPMRSAVVAMDTTTTPQCIVPLQTAKADVLGFLGGIGNTPNTPPGWTSFNQPGVGVSAGNVVLGTVAAPVGTSRDWPATVTAALGAGSNWAQMLLAFEHGTVNRKGYSCGYSVAAATTDFSHNLTAALAAGDTAIVTVASAASMGRVTVTDSAGNLYTEATIGRCTGQETRLFICPNALAVANGGRLTVTASLAGTGYAITQAINGVGRYIKAAPAASGNGALASSVLGIPVMSADVLCVTASPTAAAGVPAGGWSQIGATSSGYGLSSVLSFNTLTAAPGSWPTMQMTRAYKRLYAQPQLPNTAQLVNNGTVAAPVTAIYTGDLGQSRLVDAATGNTINLAPVPAGAQIAVDTSTLNAWAQGGASRAAYVLPGSVPLLIPPLSSASWSLYATGAGSLTLVWASAWQ